MDIDHWTLGFEAQEREEWDLAEEHYHEALRLDPLDAGLWYNRALVADAQDRLEDALSFLAEAEKLNPSDLATLEETGSLMYRLSRFEESLEAFRRALNVDPQSYFAWYRAGRALRRLERFLEAIEYLQEALRLEPESADVMNQLALIYIRRGEHQTAWECIEKGLEFDPKDPYLHLNLGGLLWQMGLDEQSLGHYEEALRIDSELDEAKEGLKVRRSCLSEETGKSRFEVKGTPNGWSIMESGEGTATLRKALSQLAGTDELVIVDRKPVDEFNHSGFVIDVGNDLVLLHDVEENTLTLNGYSVIRLKDVRSFQVCSSFVSKALRLLGRKPERLEAVNLESWKSLLDSLGDRFGLIMVEEERKDPGCAFFGKAVSVGDASLELLEINTKGNWDIVEEFFYRDLTHVGFGDGYTLGLQAVVSPHPAG